ncbi:CAP domain-containing protein [Noviherbaspirillum galbum]|uniref:CAP domain-containing protein n=1 Tax=Noviherbaspirillum galbum TaxID=2709383 RepID=A0A6B3SW07_9BURK|nr:CAP domain-containing protein [Noviherbaspirillum galbum]NEX63585.1 CAP domain-containing protein [Noviherbaspirillum galbum]
MIVHIGRHAMPMLLATLLLAACGGGGNGTASSTTDSSASNAAAASQTTPATTATTEAGAPALTGDTATDGYNWFNFRRQQLGLAAFSRNAKIDSAALGHSNYQKVNNVITHEQTPGLPAFTGRYVNDRLVAAGFTLPSDNYAYGEVISSTSDTSGVKAAEDLIAAIYHRFLIFEPMFKQAGSGAATVNNGLTYFTTNFATIGLNGGLASGTVVTYPFNGQQRVPLNFFSDNESPDPVASRNEVGYPISVHANITGSVRVTSFTVSPRGGSALPAQLLVGVANSQVSGQTVDVHTPTSAAAIIPLDRLAAGTTYDVQFRGIVDGTSVTRNWSFTTQ